MHPANFVFAMRAGEIARLLLGFFEILPNGDSLYCALASGDGELVREIWVHTPEEIRTRRVGARLNSAAALQVAVPLHSQSQSVAARPGD
jgi:hypothetical protein